MEMVYKLGRLNQTNGAHSRLFVWQDLSEMASREDMTSSFHLNQSPSLLKFEVVCVGPFLEYLLIFFSCSFLVLSWGSVTFRRPRKTKSAICWLQKSLKKNFVKPISLDMSPPPPPPLLLIFSSTRIKQQVGFVFCSFFPSNLQYTSLR